MQSFNDVSDYIMKKFILPLLVLTATLVISSCGSTKKIAYFQNADSVRYAASNGLFDAKIMPKDLLTITVITTDPKAAAPFNLTVSGTLSSTGQIGGGQNSLQTYLVDNDGYINYPVLGMIKVQGMTKRQCEDFIRSKVKPYMSQSENPVVTVKMASFKVSVTGEVNSPGVYPVSQEKINVLEALAYAGDLTIYGMRDNVLLIREDANGDKTFHRLNLNDANIINSPYYYLQQNDILYVEPNSVKAKNSAIGSSTTLWFSAIGIVTSVASLVVNIVRD